MHGPDARPTPTPRPRAGRLGRALLPALPALLAAALWPAAAWATIFAAPTAATVVQGGTGPLIQLTIVGANNPAMVPVNLVVAGLPAGATTVPSPVTATFFTSTDGTASFRFDVAPGTAPGVYPVTVAGPGGFGIGSTGVTLTVPVPSVSVTPATVAVQAGQSSAPLTVNVANVTDQSLAFAPSLPGALAGNTTVEPAAQVVAVPDGENGRTSWR
jgi:hypothetical protein